MISKNLAKFLQKEFKKQRMTYAEMSRNTNVTDVCIKNYVTGKRVPRVDDFEDILDVLGYELVISVKELE